MLLCYTCRPEITSKMFFTVFVYPFIVVCDIKFFIAIRTPLYFCCIVSLYPGNFMGCLLGWSRYYIYGSGGGGAPAEQGAFRG